MTTQTTPPPLPICCGLVEMARDMLAGDPVRTEATLAEQIDALLRPDRIAGIAAWALVRFAVEQDALADALEQIREHDVTAAHQRREREADTARQADLIVELTAQLDAAIKVRDQVIQGRDRLSLELEQVRADLAAQCERASDNEDTLDKHDRLERDYRVTVEGGAIGVLRADGACAAIVDSGRPLAALFAAAHEHDERYSQHANRSEESANA